MSDKATLLTLPDEVLRIIIGKSTTISVVRLKQCCTRLHYIINRYKLEHVTPSFMGIKYAGHSGPVQAHLEFPEGKICKAFQIPSLYLPVSVSMYDVLAKVDYVERIRLSGIINQYVLDVITEFKHKIRDLLLNYVHVHLNFEGFVSLLKLFKKAVLHDTSLRSFSPNNEMFQEIMSATSITLTGVDLPEVDDAFLTLLVKQLPPVFHIPLCTTGITLEGVKSTTIKIMNQTSAELDWNLGFVRVEDDEEMKSFVFDMWKEYFFTVLCDGDNITVSSETDRKRRSIQFQRKDYFVHQLRENAEL